MGLWQKLQAVPLAVKIALPFAIATAAPIAASLAVGAAREERLADARARLGLVAAGLAERTAQHLDRGLAVARAVAREDDALAAVAPGIEARPQVPLRLRAVFRAMEITTIDDILLVGPDGRIVISSDARDEEASLAERLGPLELERSEARVLAPVEAPDRGLVVPCLAPIGQGAGLVVALVSVAELAGRVTPGLAGPGSAGRLVIAGRPGADAAPPADTIEESRSVRAGGGVFRLTYRVPVKAAWTPTDARIAALVYLAGATGLLAAALGVLAAVLAARRLVRLEAAVEGAARGDFSIDVDPAPLDEIGRVAAAWRATQRALGEARADLARAASELTGHAKELEGRVAERTGELAQRNAELSRAADDAAWLARVASELGREQQAGAIAALLCTETRALLGAEAAIVYFLSPDEKELVAATDGLGEAPARVLVDDAVSPVAAAYRRRRPVRVEPGAANGAESLRNQRLRSVPGRQSPPGDPLAARLDPEPRSEAEHSCSTSEPGPDRPSPTASGGGPALAIPLFIREGPIGVLLARHADPTRAVSAGEQQLLETVVAEAGLAIDRARLLGKLVENERALRDFVDRAGDLIFAYGPDGRFIRANRATCATLGYTLDELRQRTFHDLVAPGDVPIESASDESVSLETSLVAKDGARVGLDMKTRTVLEAGEVKELQVIARDVGMRRELEHQQVEAEKLKTAIELAGATAHHLNQPLTGIIGYCDMLLATARDPGDRDLLTQVRTQALRMAEIVKKMVGLTRVETEPYAGKVRILRLS